MTEEQANNLINLFISKTKPTDRLMEMNSKIQDTQVVGRKLFNEHDESVASIHYAQMIHSDDRIVNLWIGLNHCQVIDYEIGEFLVNQINKS